MMRISRSPKKNHQAKRQHIKNQRFRFKIYYTDIFTVDWDSASPGLTVISSPTKITISNFHTANNKKFNKINH